MKNMISRNKLIGSLLLCLLGGFYLFNMTSNVIVNSLKKDNLYTIRSFILACKKTNLSRLSEEALNHEYNIDHENRALLEFWIFIFLRAEEQGDEILLKTSKKNLTSLLKNQHLDVSYTARLGGWCTVPLASAFIEVNDPDLLKLFLDRKYKNHPDWNINEVLKNQTSLLCLLAMTRKLDLFRVLLDYKVPRTAPLLDLNKSEDGGITPLMMACYKGNPDFVKLLFDHKENAVPLKVNQMTTKGAPTTALDMLYGELKKLSKNNTSKRPKLLACWNVLTKKGAKLYYYENKVATNPPSEPPFRKRNSYR